MPPSGRNGAPSDAFTGMAEIAGVTKNCLKAWSQRSTRLREWARNNLVVVDGEPTRAAAGGRAESHPAGQAGIASRGPNSKPSGALMRAVWTWTAQRILRRAPRGARRRALLLDRARLARMVAHIDKPAFTRADLVELVGALLPVDAPGDPRALIEQIVDVVGVRVSAPRDAHHREGHELFTVDAVIAEEQRIFDMIDAADTRARLDVRAADLG